MLSPVFMPATLFFIRYEYVQRYVAKMQQRADGGFRAALSTRAAQRSAMQRAARVRRARTAR